MTLSDTQKLTIIHVVAAAIALFGIGPLFWMAIDREPPWTRLSGEIKPVRSGGYFSVEWRTTPLKRFCPGTLQVEIISGNLIWPVLQRTISADNIGSTEYTPKPWPVSRDIPPGKTIYRVTSFWYCNWLQDKLDWPITQVGPEIEFTVLPEEKQ